MMAAAASRSPAGNFSISLYAVAVLAAIADSAGAAGAAYTVPFALLGLVAIELRSQRLSSLCIKLTALSLMLDIIFLASFGPSRGGAAMAFASLAWLVKLAALVTGRRFLVEDLGGVLGLADPAPLVANEDASSASAGEGGAVAMPQVPLEGAGGGYQGGGGGGGGGGITSSYQSAL